MSPFVRFTAVLFASLTLGVFTGCEFVTGVVGSDDSNLISLTIKDDKNNPVSLNPGFSPSTRDYTASVANTVKTVSITPMASDGKARVQVIGGDTNLSDGANLIQVLVTAENGKKATYNVTLTRASSIAVTGVTLNVSTTTVTVGGAGVALTATVAPSTATDPSVSWSVANAGSNATLSASSGASVTLNLGSSAGTATVTATAGTQTAVAVITIQAASTTGTIVFTNLTGGALDYLYVASVDSLGWGPNYLAEVTLYDGETFTLTNVTPGEYDVQAADSAALVLWDTYNDQANGYGDTITISAGQTVNYDIE